MKDWFKRVFAKFFFAALIGVVFAFWNPFTELIQWLINFLIEYKTSLKVRFAFWLIIVFALTNLIWCDFLERSVHYIFDILRKGFNRISKKYSPQLTDDENKSNQ